MENLNSTDKVVDFNKIYAASKQKEEEEFIRHTELNLNQLIVLASIKQYLGYEDDIIHLYELKSRIKNGELVNTEEIIGAINAVLNKIIDFNTPAVSLDYGCNLDSEENSKKVIEFPSL